MFYSTSAHAAKGRIKMPEMKIAVCDDEEFYRNELEKMITVYGNETSRKFTLDAWESGAALLDAVKRGDKDYDVIFLDIEMPELSGMEAAGELRSMGKNMALCFVTSFNDYALNAYQIDAIGYVIKPIQYLDFERANELQQNENRPDDFVNARTGEIDEIKHEDRRENHNVDDRKQRSPHSRLSLPAFTADV